MGGNALLNCQIEYIVTTDAKYIPGRSVSANTCPVEQILTESGNIQKYTSKHPYPREILPKCVLIINQFNYCTEIVYLFMDEEVVSMQ